MTSLRSEWMPNTQSIIETGEVATRNRHTRSMSKTRDIQTYAFWRIAKWCTLHISAILPHAIVLLGLLDLYLEDLNHPVFPQRPKGIIVRAVGRIA